MKSSSGRDIMTTGTTPVATFLRLNTPTRGATPGLVFRRLNTSAPAFAPAAEFRRLNTKDQASNAHVFRRLNTSGLRSAPAAVLHPSTTCPMGVMNRPHLGKSNDHTSRSVMTSIHLYRQVRRERCSWRVYTNEHPSFSSPPEPRLERGSVFWGRRKGKT